LIVIREWLRAFRKPPHPEEVRSTVSKDDPEGTGSNTLPLSRVGEGRSRERDGVRVCGFQGKRRRFRSPPPALVAERAFPHPAAPQLPSPTREREIRRVSLALWIILRDAADAAPQDEVFETGLRTSSG
jgi:hypothetical protein